MTVKGPKYLINRKKINLKNKFLITSNNVPDLCLTFKGFDQLKITLLVLFFSLLLVERV